jgi:hypothetical protein
MKENKFKAVWEQAQVVVDEFDWIFFDGSCQVMQTTLDFFATALSVVGLSGS